MSSLKSFFLNLNLFSPKPDNSEQETVEQHRWNLIGTRIYILLLILILIGIGLALSLISQTIKIVIDNPTKEQIDKLPSNAKCLCSQILIPYRKFTSVEVKLHSICSSDFITDQWINAIYYGYYTTLFYFGDFRTYGSAQFQSLAGFCRLSKSNINQNIDLFYSKTLLSSEVLSKNVLQPQTKSSFEQFQSIASNTFKNQLKLIIYMIIANGLISGLQTNSFFQIDIDNQNRLGINNVIILIKQDDGSVCNCQLDICNKSLSGIYNIFNAPTPLRMGNLVFEIPGMSSSCLPVTSILGSTLECFYNSTCISHLLSFFLTNEYFQSLPIYNQSIYNPQSTIQSILDNLMIENWTIDISYEKYYSECSPLSCIYFKTSRYDIKFILKKLISSFASLILILGLIIPICITFMQQIKDRRPKPKIPLSLRLYQLKILIKRQLFELNLFKHYPSSDRQIRYQRYATRLYLFCTIISFILLAFYIFTIKTIQSKTIINPTESQYIELENEHFQSLSCPCSSISMLYLDFFTIYPQYHQVCSSDIISDEWFEYLHHSVRNRLFIMDYRSSAAGQFKFLSILCEQSQRMINDALQLFLQTRFLTLQVISQRSFQIQIDSVFQDWKLTTIKTFLTTIHLFQEVVQSNRLINIFNFGMDIDSTTGDVLLTIFENSNCSCLLSSKCYSSTNIYRYDQFSNKFTVIYTVPNFFLGCFQITSLLLSTLECFYDISCMLQIDAYIDSTKAFNFSPLDPNLSLANETVDDLVNKLMVNEWLSNISFTLYYKTCAPLSCTYQYEGRNNLLVIFTIILGIFSGLSLGMKLLIVITLQFIDKIIANGVHTRILLRLIQYIFSCNTEHQIIHRLHFIFVITTLTILYYFSGFTPSIKMIQIDKPTLSTYKQLVEQSFDSFHCTCSQISIKHHVFLNVTPRFHSICSSYFISDEWISYLYGDSNPIFSYHRNDFLQSANDQFRILATLCRLSQETVTNTLLQLGSSDFIDTELLSFDSLNERIENKTMIDFERTMPKLFVNTLLLIREILGPNMILSTAFTNWGYFVQNNVDSYPRALRIISWEYNGCDCEVSSKCVSPSRGMLAGCYALETILQTPIRCLYNQTCIDSSNNFQAINMSSLLSSRFSLNSTIESLVNNLMIEELLTNISYEIYFNTCAPSLCTYSYTVKYDIIEGITTLIHLYGDLFIIYRILSIFIVKYILCQKRKIHPIRD